MSYSGERMKFFDSLYSNCTDFNTWFEVRGFDNGGIKAQEWFSSPENLCEYIESNIHKKLQWFFGVGTRDDKGGGSKKDVVEIPALWVDIDYKKTPLKRAYELIKQFENKPTFIIESGGGLHLYWRLKVATKDKDKVEDMLGRICQALEGDSSVCEVARIMRIPYSINWKYSHNPVVKVIKYSDLNYYLDDFNNLPMVERKKISGNWNHGGFIDDVYSKEYTPNNRNEVVVDVIKYYANHLPSEDVLSHVWRFVESCVERIGDEQYEYEDIKKRVEWGLSKQKVWKPTKILASTDKAILVEMWVPKSVVVGGDDNGN